ncbi:hypothetical protein [Paracoccus sp. (in: a-proteobacteria)]|uniref:hypothetical protein n=1 Tax=Paracoccus sp. TaxID=267 RepID=UPI00396CA5EE
MSKLPPVPPDNQSDKGPKAAGNASVTTDTPAPDPHQRNLDEQGRQGNIKQNTTNQGYQQNR